MSSVVIVGAGIVGASVAYHLARNGIPVTVLEQASAPAADVTAHSFAWIGDCGGDWPGGAQDLRTHVRADFQRLEAELPEFAVRWTGSLMWPTDEKPALTPGQILVGPSEIARLEPHLLDRPTRAIHTPTDGGVDPVAMAAALIRGACDYGATVIYGESVVCVNPPEGRGVATSSGYHRAETVVLAAGVATAALCEPLRVELPIGVSPACLLRVTAPPGLLRTIVANPDFEAREVRSGELLLTMPCERGQSEASVARAARRTLRRFASSFDGASGCRLIGHQVVGRPMPADGPIVGHVTADRSVYVAATHSAITLAPTLGRLIAEELTSQTPVNELHRCRPRNLAPWRRLGSAADPPPSPPPPKPPRAPHRRSPTAP